MLEKWDDAILYLNDYLESGEEEEEGNEPLNIDFM